MRTLLFAVALVMGTAMAAAPEKPSSFVRPDGVTLTHAQIDATVNQLIQAAHVTGAGLALFHDGRVVYREVSGVSCVSAVSGAC